jgi:hypothetical protein
MSGGTMYLSLEHWGFGYCFAFRIFDRKCEVFSQALDIHGGFSGQGKR